jgi:ribosomal 50S subunit-recycling heat shock protein
MRLDKFLKVSRLIKRRTLAKEVCDGGRCTLNGRVAKASTEVNVGDTLSIRFGSRTVEVRINQLQENARKEVASEMYTILSETKVAGAKPGDFDDDEELEDDR